MKTRNWSMLLSAVGLLFLIFDSGTALSGAEEGIEICIRTLIPSLFPFFVLSGLLSGGLQGLRGNLIRNIDRCFQIPEGSSHLLLLGFLSGFPVGAKNVSDSYRGNQLSREDAARMAVLCNNAGPSFLFGILLSQFEEAGVVWMLWGIQILSCLVMARLTVKAAGRFIPAPTGEGVSPVQAMNQAIRSMASVCGWVILMRIFLKFLELHIFPFLSPVLRVLVTGFLELSNGCLMLRQIESEGLRFALCAAMLSFGGLCVHLQTGSVCGELSMKSYFLHKLTQSVISCSLALSLQFLFPTSDRFSHPLFLISGALIILCLLRKNKKAVAFPAKLVYNQGNETERG